MPNFTKKAIKASFIKLLNEKPLNKISVKDIVEDCGINRNSFYYHFHDIPALIEEIVIEFFNEIIARYPNVASIEQCFEFIIKFTMENKKAMLHIYDSVKRDIYEKYLMHFCEYAVKTYIDTAFAQDSVSDADKAIIIRVLKYEMFGASIDWMSRKMPESVAEELNHMLTVCKGLSEEIIKRCQNSEKNR